MGKNTYINMALKRFSIKNNTEHNNKNIIEDSKNKRDSKLSKFKEFTLESIDDLNKDSDYQLKSTNGNS